VRAGFQIRDGLYEDILLRTDVEKVLNHGLLFDRETIKPGQQALKDWASITALLDEHTSSA
jgi:hypothetical protein